MKLRHATALALVVWYVFWPNPGKGVTYNSPLSEWDTFGVEFKSKKDCEQQMESERKYWTDQTKDGDYSSVTMLSAPYVRAVLDRKAVCAQSGDPRLNGK